MNTINITNARQNLFQLVSDVNKGFNPVNIINNKGENAEQYTCPESGQSFHT